VPEAARIVAHWTHIQILTVVAECTVDRDSVFTVDGESFASKAEREVSSLKNEEEVNTHRHARTHV
jgi:hypothetical protein